MYRSCNCFIPEAHSCIIFSNTKNAKKANEGESLLVIVFDGHFKRIETHYSKWITSASMVESKECLKSPPAALFYFMSYEKQHKQSCNLLQLHVVEKLYTTLGPQNHEQYEGFTPPKIWVIAPKHKGSTWVPMVTARSLNVSQGRKLPTHTWYRGRWRSKTIPRPQTIHAKVSNLVRHEFFRQKHRFLHRIHRDYPPWN